MGAWTEGFGTGHLSVRGLHGGVDGGLWNRASLCEGTAWGRGRRATLLGTLKDMLRKALEWASVSIGALLLGNMEGRSFLRAFEIKRCIERYVNMPCKKLSLSIGALLANLEGIRLLGLFGRKVKYIWVTFLDQSTLRF
jgi:hypothetical protein